MQKHEHEIPNGSKLYFGKSASKKRHLERLASELLENNGFSEIITPFFSYHQTNAIREQKLLRFSDEVNASLALRADSTVDVVRIITRRLKDETTKKWFYIQPVFSYPSIETYQIGAEILDSTELASCVNTASSLLQKLEINAILQVSNMKIPHLLCELLGFDMSIFELGRIELIFAKNLNWLDKLATISSLADIKALQNNIPSELKEPLNELSAIANEANFNGKIAFAPLYYSKMRYYDKLFFRFLCANKILCSGGEYSIDNRNCVGFGAFSDNIIELL